MSYILNNDDLVGFGRIESDGNVYVVYDMCIKPELQGKGLGSSILKSLLNQAKHAGIHTVGLSAWTPMAKKFYLKHGFKDSSTSLDLSGYMEIKL